MLSKIQQIRKYWIITRNSRKILLKEALYFTIPIKTLQIK